MILPCQCGALRSQIIRQRYVVQTTTSEVMWSSNVATIEYEERKCKSSVYRSGFSWEDSSNITTKSRSWLGCVFLLLTAACCCCYNCVDFCTVCVDSVLLFSHLGRRGQHFILASDVIQRSYSATAVAVHRTCVSSRYHLPYTPYLLILLCLLCGHRFCSRAHAQLFFSCVVRERSGFKVLPAR